MFLKKKMKKYKQCHVLFRHGNIIPLYVPPNDINQLDTYKEENGSLTNKGRICSIYLGKSLQQRYVKDQKLVKIKDINEQIHVRSCDIQRTYLTSYLVLKGFFDPKDNDVHVEIPSVVTNEMLQPQELYASIHSNFLKKIKNSKEWTKVTEENLNFFEHFSQLCGEKIDLSDVVCLKQLFEIEKENKRISPSWVTDEIIKKLDDLSFLATKLTYGLNDTFYKKFNAGVFLHKVITDFETAIKKPKNVKKLCLYSGQDININSVLGAMGFEVGPEIKFNAALSFELIKFKRKHLVQVYLKNDGIEFTNLKLPGYTGDINFKKFKKLYKNIMTDSLAKDFGKDYIINTSNY